MLTMLAPREIGKSRDVSLAKCAGKSISEIKNPMGNSFENKTAGSTLQFFATLRNFTGIRIRVQ